ncbi:MAG: hypothetical protein HYZ25_08465 [Chloroflexi bacterium]|nr:hypothetical protein [Chloroflexota bacterium]
MNKISLPLYIVLNLINYLAVIAAGVFTFQALNLSSVWPLMLPLLILFLYFDSQISRFRPQPRKHPFTKISDLPARGQFIFWGITIGISAISILGGFLFKSWNEYVSIFLMFVTIAAWIGLLWISLPDIRKDIFS